MSEIKLTTQYVKDFAYGVSEDGPNPFWGNDSQKNTCFTSFCDNGYRMIDHELTRTNRMIRVLNILPQDKTSEVFFNETVRGIFRDFVQAKKDLEEKRLSDLRWSSATVVFFTAGITTMALYYFDPSNQNRDLMVKWGVGCTVAGIFALTRGLRPEPICVSRDNEREGVQTLARDFLSEIELNESSL